MARAPGGARRRGGGSGRRDAAAGRGEAVRKGHWTAEEDAVLLEHVRVHGPRDWSSIRSKGFLPRTGKSCRLRWVNKLRPDLKTGCKFSAEEERVVLELQAQFGNKWARISTYLSGRTDNDVKNFWSTRQKRLARLLGTPLRGRFPAWIKFHWRAAPLVFIHAEQQYHSWTHRKFHWRAAPLVFHLCSAATPFMDAQSAALAPYDWAGSGLVGFDGALPLASDSHACSSSNAAALPPLLPFDQPPYPLLDFPGLPPAGWNMAPGFANAGAMDHLAYQELLPVTQPAPMMLPFFGTEYPHGGVKAELPDAAPDNFFEDLPPDMFDSLDQPPPPLSPAATSSGF
ncbi:unnamed protein product [Miscanthus lutarioriparius]|uniref:Uncharacterized protein n=1 Tax=Miscanthus lutarioriparius TaxID=422564 RepID=A0A811QGW2_9POAL|nr:unnamed protein product [Miscanthus lutarioriparius]